jgi:hypothetical protein
MAMLRRLRGGLFFNRFKRVSTRLDARVRASRAETKKASTSISLQSVSTFREMIGELPVAVSSFPDSTRVADHACSRAAGTARRAGD